MQRSVWNDIVNWQTRRLNNSAKYLLHASMTTTSKKKKWNLLENCHKYALKLSWNACMWHALVDQTFCGQWTNLREQSPNGPELVTNAWLVWFLTIITHVTTNSVAMWETLQNNADWDCFKTPILQEILTIQNRLQVGHYAFWEAIRLFQSDGCVRNKLQFRTVQQNLESFPWMQDWGWTVYPHLIYGNLIVAVLGNTNQSNKEQGDFLMNKREVRSTPHTVQKRKQSHGMINDLDNVDCIHPNVNSSHQEALLCVFEDNEAVIKMIIKGRSPTMRHVSRTHRVALDWLFDRINLDQQIQIKYIDTKNQLADILTKGNFTRDEWNHLLCLFNISHFSSIDCSEVMSKRTQKDASEERVTAKSKPMMNLVSRCSVRDPNVLASTASESPVKTRYESQIPLSSRIEKYDRTGRLVLDAYSSSYSERNADENRSSQEWKSDEVLEARTWRPVNGQLPGLFTQHTNKFIVDDDDMDSDTVAESDMSLKCRSFLHRVNDRVRKMQDQAEGET